jgi:hypothetical protein
MQCFTFSRTKGTTPLLMALLASSAVFSVGCANMVTTANSLNALDQPGAVTGRLHGGNQPISGATVKLWYAGEGGGAASVAATTTTSNDGTGSFAFVKGGTGPTGLSGNSFSCLTPDSLVYVVATGGNTLNSGDSSINNSAAVFLAPFGPCSSITSSSFVNMSEVSTVATMAALQQYFNPALGKESFAATSGNGMAKRAMVNSFALIPNLVDLATGKAVVTKTINAGSLTAGVGYTGTSVVATPESAKINLMANILASCVNNASSTAANCTALFANAVPGDPTVTSRPYLTSFSAPTDVLQAAYYMLTNPTNGNKLDPSTHENTRLTNLFNLQASIGAPFQSTLATPPSDWTIAISYTSASTCGSHAGSLIHSAQDLAIDFYGGVWLANNEPGKGNLTQLGSNGVPSTCIAVGTGSNTSVTIDTAGGLANIWVADAASSSLYRYKPGTTAISPFPTTTNPLAIVADGSGDLFYTSPSDATLYELPGAATLASVAPIAIATGIGSNPARVMVDYTSAVWTTSGSTFITRSASSTPTTGAGYSSIQVPLTDSSYGLSATAKISGQSANSVFTSLSSGNGIALNQGLGTAYSSATNWPVTGLSTPAAVVTDGAQNVWTINNAAGANSLFAIGSLKQVISPATGFQKSAAYLGGGRSLVIDQSGNIWIGLDGTNSITQVVGAAVPVWQPYADGLQGSKFQVIP